MSYRTDTPRSGGRGSQVVSSYSSCRRASIPAEEKRLRRGGDGSSLDLDLAILLGLPESSTHRPLQRAAERPEKRMEVGDLRGRRNEERHHGPLDQASVERAGNEQTHEVGQS